MPATHHLRAPAVDTSTTARPVQGGLPLPSPLHYVWAPHSIHPPSAPSFVAAAVPPPPHFVPPPPYGSNQHPSAASSAVRLGHGQPLPPSPSSRQRLPRMPPSLLPGFFPLPLRMHDYRGLGRVQRPTHRIVAPMAPPAISPPELEAPRREATEPIKMTSGFIDLTDDRSPSPVPEEEEVDATLNGAPPSPPSAKARGKKRAASRSRSRSPGRNERGPAPRAHLRVDNLPDGFTSEQLMQCFADVPGVLDAEVHLSQNGALWGFVSLASLATAQHAFATKNGSYAGGTAADEGARPLGLEIYSVDGTPIERPFERPRVPYNFTAAELARHVYCGSLRFDISYPEVASLFSDKAGVVARVLKVMNAHDNSHSFAFVQLPDAITADHAIEQLHGTLYEGHLLQVEHVNELNRRWLFSLSLHGLPGHWRYQDVSDLLISTIGSFAGLIVNPPRTRDADRSIQARVELRYETELRRAFTELDGLPVEGGRILRAEIEQPRIREKMDRELAYRRIAEQSATQAAANAAEAAAGGDANYDSRYPAASGAYGQAYPPLVPEGSVTLGGGRRAPPPPPPPHAPPASGQANGTGDAHDDVEGYNPFALSFLRK